MEGLKALQMRIHFDTTLVVCVPEPDIISKEIEEPSSSDFDLWQASPLLHLYQ
jgi:hypothetical protein